MQVSVNLDKVRGNALLRSMIERKIKKTDAYLAPFHPGMVDLSVYLHYQSRRRVFECKVVLKLPTATIIGQKNGFSSFEAVSKAFKTVFNEITSHKQKLKHENQYGDARNLVSPSYAVEALDKLPDMEHVDSDTGRSKFLNSVARNIQGYIYFAEKEIQRHELELGQRFNNIMAEEMVDAAIIDVYTLVEEGKLQKKDYEKNILRSIRDKIEDNIQKRLAIEEAEISLDSRISDPTMSGDDMFDYYQPDASWKLEDIYSNSTVKIGEDIYSNSEIMEKLEVALKELHPAEKQLFYLYYNQGYDANEICEILGCDKEAIQEQLEHIADKLQAVGIDLEML